MPIVSARSKSQIKIPKNIPLFPVFCDIKMNHREFVDQFASKYPYSTFNFSNLWAWDIRQSRKISILNNNIVFLLRDYETDKPFFTFVGNNAPKNTAKTLLRYAKEFDYVPELRYVPKEVAPKLKNRLIEIELDEDNSEYVYNTQSIIELEGKKLKSKRNRIRAFKRDHPNSIFKISKLSPEKIGEIDHLFELWESQTAKEDREMNVLREHTALMRLIKYAPNADLLLSTVYENEKLISFSIDEIINKKYSIGHFIKADRDIKGVYEFTNENTAKYLYEQGIEYWNWQQDLGISGLKKLKLSYQPDHLLLKYTVKLSD